MGSKIYNSNDEQKFVELIKDLKDLPKVKADDNFEYNLMVKIRNKNFDLAIPERTYFLNRALIPAAALVFSAIAIFFVINEPGVGLENPLLSEPPTRENYSQSKIDTIELANAETLTIAAQPTEEHTQQIEQPASNLVRVLVEPSDAVTVEEVNLPFDDQKSVDLDTYVLGENPTQKASLRRGRVVSGGSQPSQFEGFLIREKASRAAIEAHRARLDSLKNAHKTDKK